MKHNDRAAKKPVMMASAAGGVDIEEVAATTPEKIIKEYIDPLLGLRDYQSHLESDSLTFIQS